MSKTQPRKLSIAGLSPTQQSLIERKEPARTEREVVPAEELPSEKPKVAKPAAEVAPAPSVPKPEKPPSQNRRFPHHRQSRPREHPSQRLSLHSWKKRKWLTSIRPIKFLFRLLRRFNEFRWRERSEKSGLPLLRQLSIRLWKSGWSESSRSS